MHWQESIPAVTADKVKAAMLEGVESALGLSKGSLKRPFYSRVQLWYVFNFWDYIYTWGEDHWWTYKIESDSANFSLSSLYQYLLFFNSILFAISFTFPKICRGAALPTNTPGIPCIFDPHGRAGICGDWLLGSSLEAAALSGIALANHASSFYPFFSPLLPLLIYVCVTHTN